MEGVLYVINAIILAMVPSKVLPTEIGPIGSTLEEFFKNNWKSVLSSYWVLTTIVSIVFLLPAIVAAGFAVYFFIKIGKANQEEPASRGKKCKPCLLCMRLIAVILLGLGITVACFSYDKMAHGVDELSQNMRNFEDEQQTFLNESLQMQGYEKMLLDPFPELAVRTSKILRENGEKLTDELVSAVLNLSVKDHFRDTVNKMMDGADRVRGYKTVFDSLKRLKDETKDYQPLKWRAETFTLSKSCVHSVCIGFQTSYKQSPEVEIDFSWIPDLDEWMKKEIDDLIVAIDETEWAILDDSLNVTEDVKGSLNSTHPFMLQFLEEEKLRLQEFLKTLPAIIKTNAGLDTKESLKNNMKGYVSQAPSTWFNVGMAAVGLLLSAVFCLAIFFKPCYGDRTVLSRRWLLLGFTFIGVTWLILVHPVAMGSVVGVLGSRAFCDVLPNSKNSLAEDNRVIQSLMPQEAYIMRGCRGIESASAASDVDKLVTPLGSLRDSMMCGRVASKLQELSTGIVFNQPPIHYVRWVRKNRHRAMLASSPVWHRNIIASAVKMKENVTTIMENLSAMAHVLEENANRLQSEDPSNANVSRTTPEELINQTKSLEKLNGELDSLLKGNYTLEGLIELNHTTFFKEVDLLLDEFENLEILHRRERRQLLDQMVFNFKMKCQSLQDNYMMDFEKKAGKISGWCPLYGELNATVSSACQNVFRPLNGLWASVVWCTAFSPIGVIIDMKLALLYKKD